MLRVHLTFRAFLSFLANQVPSSKMLSENRTTESLNKREAGSLELEGINTAGVCILKNIIKRHLFLAFPDYIFPMQRQTASHKY